MDTPKDATNDHETSCNGTTSWTNISAADTSNVVEGTLGTSDYTSLCQSQSETITAESLLTLQMPKRSSTWPLGPSHSNRLSSTSDDDPSFKILDNYSETTTDLSTPWYPIFEPQASSMSLTSMHIGPLHNAYQLPWLPEGLCTTTAQPDFELR
jgi:hypothetical protein